MMSSRRSKHSNIKLSPETKNIAISLNKHKLDEEENMLRPSYLAQPLPPQQNFLHKKECDCLISEFSFSMYTSFSFDAKKIFVSCKKAASDLPSLQRFNINAVLSFGDQPNPYPCIKGGYFRIEIQENSLTKPLAQASRFLTAQLKIGNVLVHCDTGNTVSCIILLAYILKETKITYSTALQAMKKARPYLNITSDQEKFIRSYDQNKAGIIS